MRKPKHLRSCSLISIQFLPLSCIMTPCRREKVDFSKKNNYLKKQNHQKNRSTGRITRRNKKKQEKNHKNQKQTKKTKKGKTCIFRSFFCFSCFFPWFWFSSLFFWLLCFFKYFFRQTLYSLCCWTHNSCNARFPQSDLKIIGSSDSLEVI